MAKDEISISIERAMHDGLKELAQKLFDLHGVQLNSANISWYNVGTMGEPKIIVASVRIDSQTQS